MTKPKEPDYEHYRKYFFMAPIDRVKATFKATTQLARKGAIPGMYQKKWFRSPFPALNVLRRNEPVATDTIVGSVPAVDCGHTCAQIFVGVDSLVADAYGCHTDKAFVGTLQDNIRKRGAMDVLISDRAQAEISNKVKDVIRYYAIDDHQSEPHHQHQNPAERVYGDAKINVNKVMNRHGAPAFAWLLALLYVLFIMNHMASAKLNDQSPLEVLTGVVPDISMITRFYFWEPVYYALNDSDYENGTEATGRFVGFAENVGHALCYKILDDKTQKILYRSRVRSALFDGQWNVKAELETAEHTKIKKESDVEYVRSRLGDISGKMKVIDFESLIGRTFITPPTDDGSQYRASIREAVETSEKDLALDPTMQKFRCVNSDNRYDEILTYNDIMNFLEKDQEDGLDDVWRFKDILSHRKHKGKVEVFMDWENGEKTWEPLSLIKKDDPISCAIYAKKNNLLNEPGWTQLKRHAKNDKVAARLLNQAKLRSYKAAPRYKYGYQVPKDHQEAMEIDRKTGNDKFKKAEQVELGQLTEYDAFEDMGPGWKPPDGYIKIRCHMVYDIKHDGRHKARFVAGGHMTPTPIESVYSSVVSLRGIRLVSFLAELNGLELWSTDIGNAYLEAYTQEKVYFRAGPEFGERAGHLFRIHKALYGLCSSGKRWSETFSEVLKDMGFFPSLAEHDIWMRHCGDHYEYVAVYVDDLLIASKDPNAIIKALTDKYHFKLKGTGPVTFHLGCDYVRDDDGVLCWEPKKYIERMSDAYANMFGNLPKCKPKLVYSSPLDKGDHPELDTSEELDMDGIKKYQSMIGALQWCISLGRFDVATAVMSMSSFRAAPRKGHLERLKRIYGYLSKFRHGKIRVRTDMPDWSDVPIPTYEWATSIYGDVKEATPDNAPEPLGKEVITTSYVDANLYHDMMTGRSVTGILHFVNQTLIDWYSKKQGTVETATYGSEFVAARTATEQIMDLRNSLRYLGVPIKGRAYLFGDNESVVKSSSVPHSRLHKRHNALAYHRVREAIASNMMIFHHVAGDCNPADIVSKHWGHQQIWPVLRPILFHNWAPRISSDRKGSDKIPILPSALSDGQAAESPENVTRAEVSEETSDEQPATSEKTDEEDPAGEDPNEDPIDRGIRWANEALAGGTAHF